MGIAYTIDTPIRVSQFGIDSVISLLDDILIEQMRKLYCSKYAIAYQEITDKIEDFRAKRISSYLNLINTITEKKLEELKTATLEKKQEIKDYFNMDFYWQRWNLQKRGNPIGGKTHCREPIGGRSL